MKSSTQLDSIAFQLTPTRTRCDLVISANGKTEKIASGLLNPFLAHLKAAQEQIGKGGYSIVLKPYNGCDATWFTKATVERFVRFVSTPEILERVYTIESEILQIEKAISLQNSNDKVLHVVADLPVKSEEILEGSKAAPGTNDEKAIVLYQPASNQAEKQESTAPQENSRVQLVQVLEARKMVLQKEQGMAFARAIAASFDIDNIALLLAFAECFGASRLVDACKKFLHLWKVKHESGQWVEVEPTEAMSCRTDVPSTNAAGIVFLSPNEPHGRISSEKNGISDHQAQPNPQEWSPGQFPHPVFPPWQMHPQAPGTPLYQPYPMQGMPYYQNYTGNSPLYQSPYPSAGDSRLHSGSGTRQRRHSMDSRDMSTESETHETDSSERRLQDNVDSDEEDSVSRRRRDKGGKYSRKKSGTVVIRNINYIASAKHGSGDSDPHSCSESGTDDEGVNGEGNMRRKSKMKGGCNQHASATEERMSGQAGDDGNWQAFQNFLLTDADESSNSARSSMFAMEGKVKGRKRQTAAGDASSGLGRHYMGNGEDAGYGQQLDISGDATCIRKPVDDHGLSYGQEANSRYGMGCTDTQTNGQFVEAGNQRGAYRRSADGNMDYMINRQERLTDSWDPSVDPVLTSGFQGPSDDYNRGSSQGVVDESFVVLQRSGSLDQVAGTGRSAVDMDYQLRSAVQKPENRSAGTKIQNYEPNDLNLMPDRVVEDRQSGYDPAIDYEMQAEANEAGKQSISKKKVAADGPRKMVKDPKLKPERRNAAGIKREKPTKLSPSEDARARAEKLRAFKADLQKLKKEQEKEQLKRLEALKIERQKRIAARSGVSLPQSPLPSQQPRKQLPKLSPISHKGSKFSDTEPGSSSPLQRSTMKTISRISGDPGKVSKSGRLNGGSQSGENRLTRSASSLSMRKEDSNGVTPDTKVALARIRRLLEPKSSVQHVSTGKKRSAEAVSRHRVAERPEMKKTPASSNSEQSKTAVLPELKLRASKTSGSIQKKPTDKEMLRKPSEKTQSSAPSTSNPSTAIASSGRDADDNTVVEKTVVMLECEKSSIAVYNGSEDKPRIHNALSDVYKNPGDRAEEDAAIPPPASPIVVREVECEPSSQEVKGQSHTSIDEPVKSSPNFLNAVPAGVPYQAPYTRVSSLEDPCMAQSEYGKAPQANLVMATAAMQTTAKLGSDSQKQDLVKISEAASGKPHGKESSKGFKRLLKFGKKSSSASMDLDKASLDGSVADDNALNGSSSEVFTLKNLLTHEESSSAGATPKKSSRTFSLLSPFKSKSSEKKLST